MGLYDDGFSTEEEPKLKLYLIRRKWNDVEYDEYIGYVVSAESAEEAERFHPTEDIKHITPLGEEERNMSWPLERETTCVLLGTSSVPKGVVFTSFKAG